jgi:hypothetical protein
MNNETVKDACPLAVSTENYYSVLKDSDSDHDDSVTIVANMQENDLNDVGTSYLSTNSSPASPVNVHKENSKVKGLHLLHLNIHYLAPKISNGELQAELDNLDIKSQVLGFSETFLTEEVSDASIELPGYVLHRKDREGKRGWHSCLCGRSFSGSKK